MVWVRVLFIVVSYFCLSFFVLVEVAFRDGFYSYKKALFSEMIEGTAWRPFVYRVLVPKTAYIVGLLTPENIEATVVRGVERFFKAHHVVLLGNKAEYRYEYLFVVSWATLALGFSALTWQRTLLRFMRYSEHICFLVPVLGVLGIAPILLLHGPYVYDTTTLLLFSLATYASLAANRMFYYPVFILSALNKETALLLPLLFFFAFDRKMSRRRLILETTLQVLLWGAWRYYLLKLYAGNQGVNLEFHLLDNNLPFFSYFSPRHLRFWGIISVAAVLIGSQWRKKPLLLRQIFVASCVFLLPLYGVFGIIDEFRALLEMYPVMFFLAAPTLLAGIGYSQALTIPADLDAGRRCQVASS